MRPSPTLQARVGLLDDLTGVSVTGYERGSHEVQLLGVIRAVVGRGGVRRSAGSIVVSAGHASALLGTTALHLDWTDEALKFAENRAFAQRVHPTVVAAVRQILADGPTAARSVLEDVKGLDLLDDHQAVNVAAMCIPDSYGLCIFDEQGAGKTVTTIFGFDVLVSRDQADFALVVAPKSMVGEWPRDFQRFRGDLYSVAVAAGGREQKLRALRSMSDVLVTNYETCVGLEDEIRALLRRHGRRAIIVVDESFFAKNLDAQRTRSIRRLREWCGRAYVLCGSPAPNSPQDLVEQFNIVDFGATFDGVAIPPVQQAAVPVVASAIAARGAHVRHLKSEVLPDLPARSYSRVIVPMQPLQRSAYETALRKYVLDLRSSDGGTFQRRLPGYLAQRTALLQICSCPEAILSGYEETPGKRLALDSLIDDLVIRRQEKVIIWSFFTASIDAVVERYASLAPLRYDGTVSEVDVRRDVVRRFQEDPAARMLVANPAAAGAGLTLHAARIAIFESMSNQPAHYLQSLDRIHRRGQEREVEYVVLLTENSIEISEYEVLLRKERTAKNLLGDPIASAPMREVLLAEAEQAAQMLGLSM